MSPDCRTAGNIKPANKSLNKWQEFKYLGITVTNENYIHEEMMSRLNLMLAIMQFKIICLPIS
jgi:hypothetical protein